MVRSKEILNILVVEDNDLRTQFLVHKLRPHQVSIIKNPVSAVDALRTIKYDLIFLDYDLMSVPSSNLIENGTGIYVVKKLDGTINKSTPVIVHSMNIKAAEYMVGLMENAYIIPFVRLRGELETKNVNEFIQSVAKKIQLDF